MHCLFIDRGLVTISILKRLEKLSNRRIYELFDYVCGVSTGSLIAVMVAVLRIPVQEIEDLYKEFSVHMFERNRLIGAGKLFMSHAYYDTQLWERILRSVWSVTKLMLFCSLLRSIDVDEVRYLIPALAACDSENN